MADQNVPTPQLPFVNATNDQGTDLLRFLSGPNIPTKLGRLEFTDQEVNGGYRDMIDLLDYMCEMSPEYGRKNLLFGAKDDWKVNPETGHREPKDSTKTYRLELTPKRFSALYMAFLLMAHSQSPQRQPLLVVSNVVWKLAAQLGLTKQLEEDLDIAQRAVKRLKLDDDPSWKPKPAEPATVPPAATP